MAIRYSGDVEVRVVYKGKDLYIAHLRSPGEHGVIRIHHSFWLSKPTDSRSYDIVAREAILTVLKKIGRPLPVEIDEVGDLIVRRIFRSPCPIDNDE